MRAEIKMGQMLKATEPERAKGSRGILRGRDVSGRTLKVQPENDAPTLAALGLTRKEALQAQMLASLPEEKREFVIAGEVPPPSPPRARGVKPMTDAPPLGLIAVPMKGAVLLLTAAEYLAGIRRGKAWRRRVALASRPDPSLPRPS